MDFREMVKNSIKSKEQLNSEAVEADKKNLYDVAKYIYSEIKEQIVQKATRGEHNNGVITGIIPISLIDESTYNEYYQNSPIPNGYYKFFTGKKQITHSKRDSLFRQLRQHNIYHLSLSINNVDKVLEVYNVICEMGQNDGISITPPFLHAIIKDCNPPCKLIRETRIPIQNNKLEHTLRYDNYREIGKIPLLTGEQGSINLAVEYRFVV